MTQVEKERMNLVVVGHVDHGKSTVVGRLLADTDSLPEGKLQSVREKCEKAGKRFEYAFLLDALVDEQAQGITIDAARIFFQSAARHYIIIDAPGHIEFLKNMITGASHAEAAVLVIDAEEGVQENSRRHGYMLSLLGIENVIVLINKMDLVAYSEDSYSKICEEYRAFLKPLKVEPTHFIPVCALEGEGIAKSSENLSWYKGPVLLEALDSFEHVSEDENDSFRMYVQDVYKFTRFGDSRRIVAGSIDSGSLRVGDEVVFYPSGKRSTVKRFENFLNEEVLEQGCGSSIGLTLEEQIYIKRGELLCKATEPPPRVTTRIRASVFWLGQNALVPDRDYILKVGTARVQARIESFQSIIDAGSLDAAENGEQTSVLRNNVADCIFELKRPIAFDEASDRAATSRFVVLDGFHISGGGIIREALRDERTELRQRRMQRNKRWIHGDVSIEDRIERNSQRPLVILITGESGAQRKELGKFIESGLFAEGRHVYFTGIGSIIHGLDSDIQNEKGLGSEHIRRLAEVGNLMLNVGLIFVVSAAGLTSSDAAIVGELVGFDNVKTVWLGKSITTDLDADVHVPENGNFDRAYNMVKEMLYQGGYIFRPWGSVK
jgi:bifunctional enzyme CysN/CysC